jgi:DNA-binding CsgD family transcriptional regulator
VPSLANEKERLLMTTNDYDLQEKLEEKIETLRLFEKEIPAVFVVHDLRDFSVVYMSQRGLDFLGVQLENIRLGNAEYHARYFNPEDAETYVPKILDLVERNNGDELISFFQQVRPSPDHEWSLYLSSIKIFLRDNEGKPRLTITMAVPMATDHPFAGKVDRLLEENNFLRRNQKIFASLTQREKEILKLMALGINSNVIAGKLHISEATANTHRRNVRRKINAQNNYDITRFAQAFDLI